MYRHYAGRLLVLICAALIWLGYEEIDLLRGSFFWPYRYLVLALAAFLLLTALNRVMGLFAAKEQHSDSSG